MGWTSKPYRKETNETLTAKSAFEFIKKENYQYEFCMFHFVPATKRNSQSECYMLMRHHQKMKLFICCTLITIKDREIYWKDIEECCGPNYYNCPSEFFKFLKAPNLYAENWRKECKKKDTKFVPITELV